jgi:hypothetical protein
MKRRGRDTVLSAAVFVVLLVGLSSFDDRVRDSVAVLARSGSVTPMGDRIADVGSAVWSAVQVHGLGDSPMLVFAAVGAVLTFFMLRS